MQNIHIIQIDDNKEHCSRLKTLAWRLGSKREWNVQITDFQNLEEGYVELNKESRYKALILDAKCIIEKGENEDLNFLPVALRRLEEINRKTGRIYIPFAINTGFAAFPEIKSQERNIRELKGEIFDKSDEEKMLAYLFEAIEKAEETKIEKQYEDVFEVFDKGYLEPSLRNDLLTVVKKLNDSANVKNNFNPLRKFIEAIYEKIKDKDTNLIPDEVYYGRGGIGINLEWTWRYLSGMTVNVDKTSPPFQTLKPLFSEHISKNVKTVEGLSSTISHIYPNSVTTYAYKSAVFALLEILLWFKKLMEKP